MLITNSSVDPHLSELCETESNIDKAIVCMLCEIIHLQWRVSNVLLMHTKDSRESPYTCVL